MEFTFKAKLWLYKGDGAWVFATLPINYSQDIKEITSNFPRRGFGSVKVTAKASNYEWKTSIFPDKKSGSYILPIKKEARVKANINIGDESNFSIRINS